MQGAFGRVDWLANGTLFGLYHLHQPWGIPGGVLVGALFFALPGFIRLEGRNNLGLALGRSAAWMIVPLVGYWVLARILISNSTHVFIGTAVVLGGLLAVGLWRWWTMRV